MMRYLAGRRTLACAALVMSLSWARRESVPEAAVLPVQEQPADTADADASFGCYGGRSLRLVRSDARFDLVFESPDRRVARVVLRGVDLDRRTVSELRRKDGRLHVTGGDSFEQGALGSVELLPAGPEGTWEVRFIAEHGPRRKIYYRGTFDIPSERRRAANRALWRGSAASGRRWSAAARLLL